MPTYSISGSVGKSGAGAKVFLTLNITGGGGGSYAGLWMEQAQVIADSNGNYTFAGLTANPYGYLGDGTTNGNVIGYRVTPALWGFEFSPFSSDQVITAANITGVNFTKSRVYSLVQEYVANFSGTQNPLTNWTQVLDDPTGLQATSGQCEGLGDETGANTSPSGAYPSTYIPSSADCYSKSTLAAANDNDLFGASLRTDASAASVGFGTEFYAGAGTAGDNGFQILDNVINLPVFTGQGFLTADSSPYTVQVGDAVILLIRGTNLYLFLNPAAAPTTFIPVGAGSSTNTPAVGLIALQIDLSTTDHTTSAWSAFSAGIVRSAAFHGGGGQRQRYIRGIWHRYISYDRSYLQPCGRNKLQQNSDHGHQPRVTVHRVIDYFRHK